MSAAQRYLTILAVVLAALFGLAWCGYQYWETEEQSQNPLSYMLASAQSRPEICMDEQTREQIRGVAFEALDEAIKEHFKRLFEVWMRDDRDQPERAKIGVNRGIAAYLGARKNAVEWMPPACSG